MYTPVRTSMVGTIWSTLAPKMSMEFGTIELTTKYRNIDIPQMMIFRPDNTFTVVEFICGLKS